MRRRTFFAIVGAALAAPVVAWRQPKLDAYAFLRALYNDHKRQTGHYPTMIGVSERMFAAYEDDLRAGPPMMRVVENPTPRERGIYFKGVPLRFVEYSAARERRLCFKCAMVYPMPFRHDLEYAMGGRA